MVEIEIKSDGYTLYVRNVKSKILEIYDCFGDEWMEAVLREEKKYKTNAQLAYLWGVLGPLLRDQLYNMGWRVNTKEEAIEFIKTELGFVDQYINAETGELKGRVPKSLRSATIEEVKGFIEDIIIFLSEYGVDVPYLPKH